MSAAIFSQFCCRFNMYDSYTSNVAELKTSAGDIASQRQKLNTKH